MARRLVTPERLPEFGITTGDKQRKRLEAAGRFPRRVPITARTHAYVEEEILQHAERCIAQRDGSGEAA
jgi:predicted DNA-binding transcriptional regulator AlpA